MTLPDDAGTLNSYEFWPEWDPTGTQNSNRVEPDLYLNFQYCPLIIEAKKHESINNQNHEQWSQELIAWHNEYPEFLPDEGASILAICGLTSYEPDKINVHRNDDNQTTYTAPVFKSSWHDLRQAVQQIQADFLADKKNYTNSNNLERLFDLIIMCFDLNGIHDYRWLSELQATGITKQSKNTVYKWKNRCSKL